MDCPLGEFRALENKRENLARSLCCEPYHRSVKIERMRAEIVAMKLSEVAIVSWILVRVGWLIDAWVLEGLVLSPQSYLVILSLLLRFSFSPLLYLLSLFSLSYYNLQPYLIPHKLNKSVGEERNWPFVCLAFGRDQFTVTPTSLPFYSPGLRHLASLLQLCMRMTVGPTCSSLRLHP